MSYRIFQEQQMSKFSTGHTPETFWTLVDKSGGPDACWPWLGSLYPHGYGQVSYRGRSTTSHHIAYELTKGARGVGMDIDHACRNKRCCNPQHLRLATRSQNAMNSGARSDNTSGERGVCWHKANKKWCARVQRFGGTSHRSGYFDSYDEAVSAVRRWRGELFGQFAA